MPRSFQPGSEVKDRMAHEKGRGRGAGAFLAQVRSGCGAGARRLAEVIAAAQATDLRPGRWRIISVRLWRGATDLWRIRHPSISIGDVADSAFWDARGNLLRPTDQTCVVPQQHRAARRRPRVRRYCSEDRPGPGELIDLRSRSVVGPIAHWGSGPKQSSSPCTCPGHAFPGGARAAGAADPQQ